jgi:hypothetical protein
VDVVFDQFTNTGLLQHHEADIVVGTKTLPRVANPVMHGQEGRQALVRVRVAGTRGREWVFVYRRAVGHVKHRRPPTPERLEPMWAVHIAGDPHRIRCHDDATICAGVKPGEAVGWGTVFGPLLLGAGAVFA